MRQSGHSRATQADSQHSHPGVWVTNLRQAYNAYWNAQNHRESQAAYHEILLFGGKDGYPHGSEFRSWIVRCLRRLAYWIDEER